MSKIRTRRQTVGCPQLEKGPQDKQIRDVGNKVFFSCKALDPERGIMESQEPFGSTKKAMLSSARKKILVVDSSKFDQTAFAVAGSLRDVDVVVTDKCPDERWLAYFQDLGIECRYPL